MWCSRVVRTLYMPGLLGKIRTFLSKIFRPRSSIRQITALPHSWRYRLTEIWLHSSRPQQKWFTMRMTVFSFPAAVYDNLDCSDVMDSPHFSIATKLLEVINSHLFLLVPFFTHAPWAHGQSRSLWSIYVLKHIEGAFPVLSADTRVLLLQISFWARRSCSLG